MSTSLRQILPSQKTAKTFFAVVPAFNEEANIGEVVGELKSLRVEGLSFNFIVVDDGSEDKTREVAEDFGASVLCMPFNMGIGMTVQTGFKYALAHKADYVFQVDGDGQHIPSEVAKLVPYVLNGEADVAIGTRFLTKAHGHRSTTFLRWMAGRFLSKTIYFLTGQKFTDTTSGFRLYNRKAAEFVASQYPDDYPEVEILVMLVKQGFRIKEVPVEMRNRRFGHSSINWWRSIYYVIKVVFASIMDKVRK